MVMAHITPEAWNSWLGSMNRCGKPIRSQVGHLGRERLRTLTELLRDSRSELAA
jgi:hypothetical protein